MIPRLELSAIVCKRLCSSCAVTPTDLVFTLTERTSAVSAHGPRHLACGIEDQKLASPGTEPARERRAQRGRRRAYVLEPPGHDHRGDDDVGERHDRRAR